VRFFIPIIDILAVYVANKEAMSCVEVRGYVIRCQ
jgi:hypothetical protein